MTQLRSWPTGSLLKKSSERVDDTSIINTSDVPPDPRVVEFPNMVDRSG